MRLAVNNHQFIHGSTIWMYIIPYEQRRLPARLILHLLAHSRSLGSGFFRHQWKRLTASLFDPRCDHRALEGVGFDG